MKRISFFATLLTLGWMVTPLASQADTLIGPAQAGPGHICSTTYAALASACHVSAAIPQLVHVTDSNTVVHGGTVAGGGANAVLAYCTDATTCYVVADDAIASGIVAITGTTADTFTVDSGGSTTGTSAFVSGDTGESIVFGADGTFDLTRDTAGVVVLTASDDNAVAQLTVQSGGAAPMQLGGADTTQIDLQSDSDYNLINTSSNSVSLHFRDYGDTADDDMAHGSINVNCTDIATGTEDCDMTINTVTAGAAVPRVSINADGDTTFNPPASGGNAGVRHRIVGLPKITMVSTGAGTNGPVLSEPLMDDSPDGECAPIVAGTEALDAANYRVGAASYQYTFQATVGAGEGVDCDITGHAVVGSTSVGFWFMSDTTFASGDLEIVLDDGGAAEATENFPAYSTANVWQWVEVDVTADCAATCADLDGWFLQTTAQAPTTFNAAVIHIDQGAVWLAACEEALGVDILEDGVLGVMSIVTATGGNRTPVTLAEWTDYFVHYETGNDFICAITDQSANSNWALVALE